MTNGIGEFIASLLTYPILIVSILIVIVSVVLILVKGQKLNKNVKTLVFILLIIALSVIMFQAIMAIAFGSKQPPALPVPNSNNVSLLSPEQQKAVNNSLNYIKNSPFAAKDRINTNIIEITSANEKTWESVWSKDSKVENNAVDSTDWIITIGDISNHDFAIIVCDSNTCEVIGHIPIK